MTHSFVFKTALTSLVVILTPSFLPMGVYAQEIQPLKQEQKQNVEAIRSAKYGSQQKFLSRESLDSYTFNDQYLGKHVVAPLQLVQTLQFDQSPDEVFDWVTSGNARWSRSIERLTWDHGSSQVPGTLNVGSVRRCDFVGGAGTAYERVLAFEENRLFAYDLDPQRSTAPLPIKDFFVIWTLEDKGADGTLVVARMYYHEAQDANGKIAAGVAQSLISDFQNFANVYRGVYVTR